MNEIKNLLIKRPVELPCDIHRIEVGGCRWYAFVGLYKERVFEIFFADIEESSDIFFIPKTIKKGMIIRGVTDSGEKVYNFKYVDKQKFGVTVENIGRVLDASYYNYVLDVSFMLRYLPNKQVIHIIKKWRNLTEKQEILRELLIRIIGMYKSVYTVKVEHE